MFEQTLTNNNHLMDYYCLVSWDYFSCTYFVKWQSEMLKRGHNNRIVPFQVFSSDYKLYLYIMLTQNSNVFLLSYFCASF